MKKYGIFLVALAALLNLSCDEEFAPKIPFEEKYFLYTALKGDSTKQIIMVARSYDVANFDPNSNTSAPEIPGCIVEVVQDGVTYRFRDTLIDRPDTSRYGPKMAAYVSTEFIPMPERALQARAILPNGKLLTSSTVVPPQLYIEKSVFAIGYDRNSTLYGRYTLQWRTADLFLYVPKLEIFYTRDDRPGTFKMEVPLEYRTVNKKLEVIYPSVGTNRWVSYDYNAIDSAMNRISEGYDYKGMFRVLRAEIRLLVYDTNFAKYYSSVNGYLDQYSVRLDENVFTNINGGLGVFGSYMMTKEILLFDLDYVASFGYRVR
ncbi:MAG: DUF4249 family protein [Chlorobiota bacterium]|nr:MAG: DUF4249 family protein [Chlorobiota bacterium]